MAKNSSPLKLKRVVLYIPTEMYNQLQSILRRKGQTASGWFREQVKRLLDREGNDGKN